MNAKKLTTEEAVLLSLPTLVYHKQCRLEMAKLLRQRDELRKLIELRKSDANAKASPLLLKVDIDKVIQMINN